MQKTLLITLSVLFLFSFQQTFSQANAGLDQEICADSTYLEGNDPYPYSGEWTRIAGTGIIVDETLFNTQVKNLYHGIINKFVWTVFIQGESFSDTVVIINNAPFVFTIDDIIVCTDNTTLYASPLEEDETGLWTVIEGEGVIVDPTNNITQVTDLSYQENTFRWTVTNGYCTASSEQNVFCTKPDSIYLPYNIPDQEVCEDNCTLEANPLLPGWEGYWQSHGSGIVVDPTNTITEVYNLSIGDNYFTYTIFWPEYGCSYAASVKVTYNYLYASAGEDAQLCEDYYQMNAEHPEGTNGIWTITGTGGGTIEDHTAWNTNITNLESGTNRFEWYVNNEYCSSRDTVALTYNLPPIAQFEADLEDFTAPQEVIFTNTSDYWLGWTEPDEFLWNINDVYFETTYNINETTYNINETVTYTFTNTGETDSIYYITLIAEDYQTACVDTFVSSVLAHPEPESIDFINTEFKVYPNPTNGLITISSSINLGDAIFELTNISGQELQYKLINKATNACTIDMSNLAKGMYFLKIRLDNQTKMLRLIRK